MLFPIKSFEQRDLNFLAALAEQATAADVNSECRLLLGNPGRSICELARTWGTDLIILGRRGHSGLQELILGSVSNYVTHHASCSVLVIHSPSKAI